MALATPYRLILLNLIGSLLFATTCATSTTAELSQIPSLTVFSGESAVVHLPRGARVRTDDRVVYELHALAGVLLAPISHGRVSDVDLARGQATVLLPESDKNQEFLLRVLKARPNRTPPEVLFECRLNSSPRLVPTLLAEMVRAGFSIVRLGTAQGLASVAPALRTASQIAGGSDPLLIWIETQTADEDPEVHYDSSITVRFTAAPEQVHPRVSGDGNTWILDCPRDWPTRLAADPSVDHALAIELRALWHRTFPETQDRSQP